MFPIFPIGENVSKVNVKEKLLGTPLIPYRPHPFLIKRCMCIRAQFEIFSSLSMNFKKICRAKVPPYRPRPLQPRGLGKLYEK